MDTVMFVFGFVMDYWVFMVFIAVPVLAPIILGEDYLDD